MYSCVMGMTEAEGEGCILADEMGLGKTLSAIALVYTMLSTSTTICDSTTDYTEQSPFKKDTAWLVHPPRFRDMLNWQCTQDSDCLSRHSGEELAERIQEMVRSSA
jgi:hypothetical protein